MTPFISVITTLYNCERFVQESLDSIANQSYQNFEWLLVNDGSTDSTWDIVKQFKHPNIVLVDNADNKKIPFRRNQAIEMAKGRYIAIHDGDDVSLPDRLKIQSDFVRENTDIFCVGGWAIQISENSEEQRLMQYPPTKIEDAVKMLFLQRRNPIIDPTCMFRRDVFIKLGRYTLEKAIFTVPDMDLWARSMVAGYDLVSLPKALIKYRINPDGMTRKFKKEMIVAHQTVWQRFYREMKKSRSRIGG